MFCGQTEKESVVPTQESSYFIQNISHSLKGSHTSPSPIKLLCGSICSCFRKEVDGSGLEVGGSSGLDWTVAAGEMWIEYRKRCFLSKVVEGGSTGVLLNVKQGENDKARAWLVAILCKRKLQLREAFLK